jgi:hypothetical protein
VESNKECNCASCQLAVRLGISREIVDVTSHIAVAVKLIRLGVLSGDAVDALVVKCLHEPSPAAAFAGEIRKLLQTQAGLNGPVQVVPIVAVAQPAATPKTAEPWPDWALRASKN